MSGAEWLLKLLVTACVLGGYPQPSEPPPLHSIPQHDLAMLVCGTNCPVHGAYIQGRGIFLSDTLDLNGDPMDRSVLLHESVHYLQDINRRFAQEEACDRYRDRELEAYDIQDRYLARYGRGVGHLAASLEWVPAICQSGAATPEKPQAAGHTLP